MKKKNVVILYKGTNSQTTPFQQHLELREYIFRFQKALEKEGFNTYISHYSAYEKKAFAWAWKIGDGSFNLVHKKIVPAVIYERNTSESLTESEKELRKINAEIPTVNKIDFKLAMASKISQQLIFSDLLAKGWILQGPDDLQKLWKSTKFKELVIKPEYGMGGKGVTLLKRGEKLPKGYTYPCVAQKRLDGKITMKKIPKNRIGDVRVVINCGKIIYAFSRLAPVDSFLTNVKQGGNAIFLTKSELPKSMLALVEKVSRKIEIFGDSEYCVDMMFHKGKPYLVEVNTMAGVVSLISQKKDKLIDKQIAAQISMLTSIM